MAVDFIASLLMPAGMDRVSTSPPILRQPSRFERAAHLRHARLGASDADPL